MFEASSDTECELPAGGIDFRKLSEQVMTHLFQNPRSGWKHKAWGGAKRNPRVTKRNQTERAERATGQALRFTVMKGYRPLRGLSVHTPTIPGVPLPSTPGFMRSPRFAGSRKIINLFRG